MSYKERRDHHQPDSGRRLLVDRRSGDDDNYSGTERRSGIDRRCVIDRRR